ncbi:MAG: hypothetical protein Q4D42_11515, partial [Eubacteriales bacterium]|nr:hypothetical protein [Eubacteriales bacterium]
MYDILVSFVLSDVASVVSYYMCKWLDGKNKKQTVTSPGSLFRKNNRNPQQSLPVGGFVVYILWQFSLHLPICNVPQKRPFV